MQERQITTSAPDDIEFLNPPRHAASTVERLVPVYNNGQFIGYTVDTCEADEFTLLLEALR